MYEYFFKGLNDAHVVLSVKTRKCVSVIVDKGCRLYDFEYFDELVATFNERCYHYPAVDSYTRSLMKKPDQTRADEVCVRTAAEETAY